MIAAGLLMTNEERGNLRFWATLPYAHADRLRRDQMDHRRHARPADRLSFRLCWSLTVLFAIIRWFSIDRRTQAGLDAVAAHRGISRIG